MTSIHVLAPDVVDRAITACNCPDCGKRTRMIGFFQKWFGWQSTCLRCGRQWDGGEWLQLEFRRGVRADNISQAKERWRNLNLSHLEPEA